MTAEQDGLRIVLDDADQPAVEGGVYRIAYGELVDGYRHAYASIDRFKRRVVRYSRTADHPIDPACPQCAYPLERLSGD